MFDQKLNIPDDLELQAKIQSILTNSNLSNADCQQVLEKYHAIATWREVLMPVILAHCINLKKQEKLTLRKNV